MSTPLSCARRIKAASDALVTPQPSVYINAIVVLFLSGRTEPARAAADAVRRQYVLFSSNLRFSRRQRGKVRMAAEGRRGSPRPLRGRQLRGFPRRSYALSRGSETAAENDRILRALRGGCRVQSTPRFPVRRRGKSERLPYAAALTLFSGVRSSDVSAPQAGKIRITAVYTLLLHNTLCGCFPMYRVPEFFTLQAGKIRITAVHTLLFIILYAVIIARPKAFCNFFRAFCVFGF